MLFTVLLGQRSGLSAQTVSVIFRALEREKLVLPGAAGPGRAAVHSNPLKPRRRSPIGASVTTTTIYFALVGFNGVMRQHRKINHAARDSCRTLEKLISAVAEFSGTAASAWHDHGCSQPRACDQKIRLLTVVDTVSRFSPAIDPRFGYRAEDFVATLERVCHAIGYPKTIRIDQGSEFVSRDPDLWAYTRGVTLDFSRPGKPIDNAFIEAFNGCFRAECLNAHWFLTLGDAREKLKDWRKDYNEVRPHGAIGNRPPVPS